MEVANSLSALEARLDSIELDIARVVTTREEDSRRISGEMQVMRARVEDALTAVTDTAQELRDAWVGIDTHIAELIDSRFDGQQTSVDAIRAQLAQGLEATRMAVEAAEARLHGEVEALSGTSVEQVRAISDLVEQARSRADEVVAEVESRVGEALAGTRVDNGSFGEELGAVASQLRDEMAVREKAYEERIGAMAERVGSTAFLTRRVADLEVRLAELNAKLDRTPAI